MSTDQSDSLKVVQPLDEADWEAAVSHFPEANFLVSWAWGQFQIRMGKQVNYQIYKRDNQVVGTCLFTIERAKRGSYLSCPGTPVLDWQDTQLVSFWLKQVEILAKKEKLSFVRVRPQALDTPDLRQKFNQLGFNLAPMHLTADLTIQLDLTQDLEQILKQMRKNTRYEVRKAEKLGLTSRLSTKVSDIQSFYQHQLELAEKHNFVPFSLNFLKNQFQEFVSRDQAVLVHTYDQSDQLLASAFIITYGQEAVYHYGISTPENQKKPGAYLAQWRAIEYAKKHGCTRYNFWGVNPKDEPNHRFAGVGTFKRGFGGQEVAYLPAHDLPTSWWYNLVRVFETFRAKKRGL